MSPVDDGPEIAIVTVALNAARDLPLTIESVLAQTYPRLQFVVADGTSWDESDVVLSRYSPHIDRLVVRPDAGIYHAMNSVADEVKADYVLFLNAGDQFWSEEAVERIAAELDGRPDIFYGNHIYVDRRREFFKRAADFDWLAERLKMGLVDHLWHSAIPGHQATFTRTDLLRRLRFDTRFRISADHDLLFRAHASGARMQYIDECVAHYHGGGFSALAGERTTLEGASIYRRFSEHPHKVDALFFPGSNTFNSQTETTGFFLGGFTRLDSGASASGVRAETCWVAAEGASIVTPPRQVIGIVLRGYNEFHYQGAEILVRGHRLASVAVPAENFRLNVSFDEPIEASEILDIVPWKSMAASAGERVGFALQSFQFLSVYSRPEFVLVRGDKVAFSAEMWRHTQELRGSGWSDAEETHTWSIGTSSDLWLPIATDVRRVKMLLTGNSHVPGGEQRIDFKVNGAIVAEEVFMHGERKEVVFTCEQPPWQRGGSNNLAIWLHHSAVPPEGSNDRRDLGVCFWKLEIE